MCMRARIPALIATDMRISLCERLSCPRARSYAHEWAYECMAMFGCMDLGTCVHMHVHVRLHSYALICGYMRLQAMRLMRGRVAHASAHACLSALYACAYARA